MCALGRECHRLYSGAGASPCAEFRPEGDVMPNEAKQVALEYIEACGRKDYDTVSVSLSSYLSFVGPGNALTGEAPYLAVLRRLGPVWRRSDVKKVFVDGNEVCVIYDFVTDTPAGAVPIVEWLRVHDG